MKKAQRFNSDLPVSAIVASFRCGDRQVNSADRDKIVTLVIDHDVLADRQDDYERWLKRAVSVAAAHEGHLGVNVIRPERAGGNYVTIIRFAAARFLDAWVESDARKALIAEVAPLLNTGDHYASHASAEFWFTPKSPEAPSPLKWKQAVLTYLVILPLATCIPLFWKPVFDRYPVLGGALPSNVIITLCIVVPVVYLIMPWATRRLSGWLSAR
jgi:antibiotic biosynthesis monooxygenase (ABM) superfamily enzyme